MQLTFDFITNSPPGLGWVGLVRRLSVVPVPGTLFTTKDEDDLQLWGPLERFNGRFVYILEGFEARLLAAKSVLI